MTPTNLKLVEAGALLYGGRWQADMARSLSVSRRTVVNWTNGVGAPSAEHWGAIRGLLKARAKAIGKLAETLP